MKLYELLKNSDGEFIVWDVDYDIEVYFYGTAGDETLGEVDAWDKAMTDLSKLLDVKECSGRGVTVNLSELIEKNIKKLDEAQLFIHCDIDAIMDDIMAIFSGNVPEEWMTKFVEVLKGQE